MEPLYSINDIYGKISVLFREYARKGENFIEIENLLVPIKERTIKVARNIAYIVQIRDISGICG